MTYSFVYDNTKLFLTPDANGRKMNWMSTDNADNGPYDIRVKAVGPAPELVESFVEYTLTV